MPGKEWTLLSLPKLPSISSPPGPNSKAGRTCVCYLHQAIIIIAIISGKMKMETNSQFSMYFTKPVKASSISTQRNFYLRRLRKDRTGDMSILYGRCGASLIIRLEDGAQTGIRSMNIKFAWLFMRTGSYSPFSGRIRLTCHSSVLIMFITFSLFSIFGRCPSPAIPQYYNHLHYIIVSRCFQSLMVIKLIGKCRVVTPAQEEGL